MHLQLYLIDLTNKPVIVTVDALLDRVNISDVKGSILPPDKCTEYLSLSNVSNRALEIPTKSDVLNVNVPTESVVFPVI